MQKHWRLAEKLGQEYGYTLKYGRRGNAHAQLVRPGYRSFTVSSSPRDVGNMMNYLRQNLQRVTAHERE